MDVSASNKSAVYHKLLESRESSLKWVVGPHISDEMLNVWRRVTVRERPQPYLV
jgi:hypothetical protein